MAALGVLALILGAAGWMGLTPPSKERTRAAPVTTTTVPVAGGTVLKAARPTHLRIPAIDVSATVTSLGIHPDRTVEVPANPDQAGWYRLGSHPGQAGSAVILGHVDSTHGPAVFYRLRSLTRGDGIAVRASDGSITHFEVTSISTYANADFPAQKVYRSTGRPGLALVTCGGRYDAAHGGYQANVVVFADLVSNEPR
ncbi:class F sortase [Nocardioides pocheonensis]|uniref:class F sortase n=1 Tax=Nocardioides pocheonensis TaxID=661485 RepID=UPI001C836468|nr:class F sortase [Nocardioides pocheonensis]